MKVISRCRSRSLIAYSSGSLISHNWGIFFFFVLIKARLPCVKTRRNIPKCKKGGCSCIMTGSSGSPPGPVWRPWDVLSHTECHKTTQSALWETTSTSPATVINRDKKRLKCQISIKLLTGRRLSLARRFLCISMFFARGLRISQDFFSHHSIKSSRPFYYLAYDPANGDCSALIQAP